MIQRTLTLLTLSLALMVSSVQGQFTPVFTLEKKAGATGPFTGVEWNVDNSVLWGTDASGNPVNINDTDQLLTIFAGQTTGTGSIVLSGDAELANPILESPGITGMMSLPNNVRQSFNPGATHAGLNVGAEAFNPSAPENGDIWYNSADGDNALKARINGVTVPLGPVGGGLTNIASTVTGNTATFTGSLSAARAYTLPDAAGTLALTSSLITSLTGDVSGSGTGAVTTTLANSGVTAGTYNPASITVDAKGRVTSASSFAVNSGPGSLAMMLASNSNPSLYGYEFTHIQDPFGSPVETTMRLLSSLGTDGREIYLPASGGTLALKSEAGSKVLLGSTTASASSAIIFENVFSSDYDAYELEWIGLKPVTDGANLRIQLRSTTPADITDTFASTGTFITVSSGTGPGSVGASAVTTGWTFADIGNDTNESTSGRAYLWNLSSGVHMKADMVQINAAGDAYGLSYWGLCNTATARGGVKIYFSSGNIASGLVRLYGIRNN